MNALQNEQHNDKYSACSALFLCPGVQALKKPTDGSVLVNYDQLLSAFKVISGERLWIQIIE